MNRLGLKINGIWCVLPQDVSISIEEQNPLFSDSGSFSYPIELSVSQNRELFQSIDSPHGRIRPQDLDGLPFEFWYDGMMLLYGSIETDEDLDIEEDKCSINLVSGNGDFKSKIEGLQCTDVPLMSDVHIGYLIDRLDVYIRGEGPMDMNINTNHTMSYNNVNVSDPYPLKPYCNVRICVKRTDDYKLGKDVPYWVYDADRPWSGVCFYVAYFLDCLFNHLGYVVKENNLPNVDDMMRLAFFTTKCEHDLADVPDEEYPIKIKDYSNFLIHFDDNKDYDIDNPNAFTYSRSIKKVFATGKNFPETDVSSVVESLFSAFGVKIVANEKDNTLSVFYIRDILRDQEVIDTCMTVIDRTIQYTKTTGVKITYGGDEDNTAFNYKDWNRIYLTDDFNGIVRSITPDDKNLYIHTKTGNKYRVKVDEDAETESELYPSLLEVAQFNDFVVGKDSKEPEEIKISFSPVIENSVTSSVLSEQDKETSQRLAVYVDAEMKKYSKKEFPVYITHYDNIIDSLLGKLYICDLIYNDPQSYDETQDNPLRSHDSGFTLGVMRGAGSESATEVYLENYDGNGNSAWTTVVADYAFTADTMDAYGNRYDYNGTTEGGIADQENSISLKTHIQTAKDVGLKNEDGTDVDWGIDANAAKRGLADRFMSEYMYFLLHRKTVSMEVDTTLTQLTNLSWFKQLRINDTVGRLKSRSYTLTNNGVTDMNIELYTIN